MIIFKSDRRAILSTDVDDVNVPVLDNINIDDYSQITINIANMQINLPCLDIIHIVLLGLNRIRM